MILTSTSANSWIHPDVKNWPDPESVDDLIQNAVEVYEAGATIYHVHLPRDERASAVSDSPSSPGSPEEPTWSARRFHR